MNVKRFATLCSVMVFVQLGCGGTEQEPVTGNEGTAGVPNVTQPSGSGGNPGDIETSASGGTVSTSTDPEALCTETGGEIVTGQCCAAISDFPKSCNSTGACGCSPQYSKPVRLCACGNERCFDPLKGCI